MSDGSDKSVSATDVFASAIRAKRAAAAAVTPTTVTPTPSEIFRDAPSSYPESSDSES